MGANFEMVMNEFLPLRDVVFNTLRKAILTGELKPGERLMEIHLANKLGGNSSGRTGWGAAARLSGKPSAGWSWKGW